MRKHLGIAAFVATLLFSTYIVHFNLSLAGSLLILFMGALTTSILYLDQREVGTKSTESDSIRKLKEDVEIETLKANLERIQYQNTHDKAKRDELAAQGKINSGYMF